MVMQAPPLPDEFPKPVPGWALVISPGSGKIVTAYRLGDSRLAEYQRIGYIIWEG